MPTIAIVGAGPGLGLSIAKVFGGHGFDVALISRTKDKLDALVAELAEAGITAEGFPADVANSAQLTGALEAAIARFGRIDVLEFSPHAGLTMASPKDVTLDNLRPQIDSLLYGAVAAVQTVLPGMLQAKAGTLLFTTGGGAVNPYPMLADANIAQAGQRNWAINLHKTDHQGPDPAPLGPRPHRLPARGQSASLHRVLTRYRLARLTHHDRATGRAIRRHEHHAPGEMVHADIKKLGNIPDGGGHQVLGRQAGRKNRSGGGYSYLHNAVDDHSRLAYSKILADEKQETAAATAARPCCGDAIAHYGRIAKTLHILRLADEPSYRRQIKAQANLALPALPGGHGGPDRRARPGPQRPGAVQHPLHGRRRCPAPRGGLRRPRAGRHPGSPRSSGTRHHVNMLGRYSFLLPEMPGGLRPLRDPEQADRG